MPSRLRLFMGATALLYIGPLLAGLGGYGWSVVPVFVLIFILWLFIMRPQQWPRRLADWSRPEALVTLAAQGAVQVLLVTILFGIGRGIGGVLGFLPLYSPLLPIAVSFLSIPLSRLIWDPWKAAEMDRFLDTAIASINSASGPDADHIAEGTARAAALLEQVYALPPDTPEAVVASRLRALEREVDLARLRDALLDHARTDPGDPAPLRTLAIFATDGRIVEILGGTLPTFALYALPADPALMALFARRGHAALTEDSDLWGDFPTPDLLRELALSLAGTGAEAPLLDLAALTDRLAPPEDGG